MVGINSNNPPRDRVFRLMAEKDLLEAEIQEQTLILEANNVGMYDSLVDDQGFPRTDIDVYKVRHARHAIICLQNDHKDLMRRIEEGLADVYAEYRPNRNVNEQSTPNTSTAHHNGHAPALTNTQTLHMLRNSDDNSTTYLESDEGFAKITSVQDGSPAHEAGLQVDDEVLQFGSVNVHNFMSITQVHDVVAHCVHQNVRVLVLRNHQILNLTVTPRPWGQPGWLGCQIVRRDH